MGLERLRFGAGASSTSSDGFGVTGFGFFCFGKSKYYNTIKIISV